MNQHALWGIRHRLLDPLIINIGIDQQSYTNPKAMDRENQIVGLSQSRPSWTYYESTPNLRYHMRLQDSYHCNITVSNVNQNVRQSSVININITYMFKMYLMIMVTNVGNADRIISKNNHMVHMSCSTTLCFVTLSYIPNAYTYVYFAIYNILVWDGKPTWTSWHVGIADRWPHPYHRM